MLLPETTEPSRAQGKQEPRGTGPAAATEDGDIMQERKNCGTHQPDHVEREIEQLLEEWQKTTI